MIGPAAQRLGAATQTAGAMVVEKDRLADSGRQTGRRRRHLECLELFDHPAQTADALAAGRALGEVQLHRLAKGGIELVIDKARQQLDVSVHGHGRVSKRLRRCSRPRAIRDRTVPTRTRSTVAISR